MTGEPCTSPDFAAPPRLRSRSCLLSPSPIRGMKAAMTVIPVFIILIHKEWRLARYAARIVLWAYILLAIYHIFLLLKVSGAA